MRCAVIGGGINGVMSAWALARRGHQVDLYERNELMGATSSASTKLIHGGIRYLESGQFRLVRESLRERLFWISAAPDLVHKLELILPVYKSSRRSRWLMRCGLVLYDLLAGQANLGGHRWMSSSEAARECPGLNLEGLVGAFVFFDAQMDDHALGLWAAAQSARAGVAVKTQTPVNSFTREGDVDTNGNQVRYEIVANVAGPWAEALLRQSGIASRHSLDLVRGSHLVLPAPAQHAFLVEVPGEERFCFILPYQGRTLVGTTEVWQKLNEPIECSPPERSYLLNIHNHYIHPSVSEQDIVRTFSGLRPLIRSDRNLSRSSREYVIESNGRVVSVFGGKWTTSHALGEKLALAAERTLRKIRDS